MILAELLVTTNIYVKFYYLLNNYWFTNTQIAALIHLLLVTTTILYSITGNARRLVASADAFAITYKSCEQCSANSFATIDCFCFSSYLTSIATVIKFVV